MTEEILPKPVRTWTIFKNTNNTLEGIEALAFAMWQVALDEIEKESDNVVFMSDNTVKIIMGTLEHLEQENNSLQAQLNNITVQSNNAITALEQENKELKEENALLKEQLLKKSETEQALQSTIEENRCLHESIDGAQIIINGYIELTGKYKSALEEIKEDMEQDTTCESRECGCDDYAECLNCIKETILNKINECLGK